MNQAERLAKLESELTSAGADAELLRVQNEELARQLNALREHVAALTARLERIERQVNPFAG